MLIVSSAGQAHNITDVVVACRETGLEWFEQLLQTLFKPKEDKDDATKVIEKFVPASVSDPDSGGLLDPDPES